MASGKEIRISIKTALDAAGIEATKAQLEALTGSVEKTNRAMKRAATEGGGEWTKLPGVFGKVQSALDGVVGKAFAVIGAFKTGWDIGNWIEDNIIVPLFKIKDPIEELKKQNRQLKREAEAAASAWAKGQEAVAAQLDASAKAADAAVAKIDKLAAAYIRMQNAKQAVAAAETDAEELTLQRDKFTDMTKMADAGSPEQSAQIGKYYDVLLEELKAKKAIAKTDAAIAANAKEIETREQSIAALKERERGAEERYKKAELTVTRIDNGDELGTVWGNNWDKAMETAKKNRDKALAEWKRLTEKRKESESDLGVLKVESEARKKDRENTAAATQLEIDKRKREYADYVADMKRQNVDVADVQRKANKVAIDEEKAARQRMERELLSERISNLKKLADEQRKTEAQSDATQAAAASRLQQAWGWYRDKGSMKAQLQEERDEAKAQQQYEIDFNRLKGRHLNWREATNLTVDEEAVRRVALAREEKEAADKWAEETAENTRNINKTLNQLLKESE